MRGLRKPYGMWLWMLLLGGLSGMGVPELQAQTSGSAAAAEMSRKKIPDVTAADEATLADMRIRLNLPYLAGEGRQIRQRLDIYAPAEGDNLPVILWIHGGGWRLGGKWLVDLKPRAFTAENRVLVSINYRLHPTTDFRGQAADVAAAIAWVRENIAQHGGNGRQIVLMGHSAGAHLAALVATDPSYLAAHQLTPAAVQGVILIDGAGYDIAQHIRETPKFVGALFTTVFGTDPADHRAASPLLHVNSDNPLPPFLIFYVAGRQDAKSQSTRLAETLTKAGGQAELVPVAQESHATINMTLGIADKLTTRKTFEFLEQLPAPPAVQDAP